MKSLSNLNKKDTGKVLSSFGGVKSSREPEIKSKSGIFSNFMKRTKLEVIDPILPVIDQEDLKRLYMRDLQKEKPELYEAIQRGEIDAVPDNLMNDLFQLQYMSTKNVSMDLSDLNPNSYKLVKSFNDEDSKMITNYSPLNSYIFTKHLMYMLQKKLQDEQGGGGSGPESGSGDEKKEKLAGMLSMGKDGVSKGNQKMIEKVKDAAKKEIEDIENSSESLDALKDETPEDQKQKGQGGGNGSGSAGAIHQMGEYIKNRDLFKGINMNNKVLNDMIKHSLQSTVSYFTSRFTEVRENLFESEDVSEVLNSEMLIPGFEHIFINDLETVSRKYKMAIDIYLDISGSMDCNIMMLNQNMTRLNISKLLILKIFSKGIVKDMYAYDTSISGPYNTKQMMKINSRGGTETNRVIERIIETKRPALIITDACDHIHVHTDMAYFIGVGDARLYGKQDIIEKYEKGSQGIVYTDSNTFKKINT